MRAGRTQRIAAEPGCAEGTVRTWRHRFARDGMPALRDRPRSGRPEVYGTAVRLAIVATATSVPPEDRPEWTHALIAAELACTGISASQAGRILADLELRPHKVRGWLRRADDAQFWAQAAAVCDACLRPPPDTIVICIDEKTGIQAKYRKYPGRLPAPGRPARREFEYVRNGTVSIIAALHAAIGHVVAEPVARNNSAAFTGFLHRLTQCIDPHRSILIIMDNGSSHTSRATRAWIAAHPQITVTCTPKHASWPDMAELWFSVLTRGLLRRGEFTSRADLIDKITSFTIRYKPDRQTLDLDLRRPRRPRTVPRPPPPPGCGCYRPADHRPNPSAGRLTTATASMRPPQGFLRRCTS